VTTNPYPAQEKALDSPTEPMFVGGAVNSGDGGATLMRMVTQWRAYANRPLPQCPS
jgi:hypothetical protein